MLHFTPQNLSTLESCEFLHRFIKERSTCSSVLVNDKGHRQTAKLRQSHARGGSGIWTLPRVNGGTLSASWRLVPKLPRCVGSRPHRGNVDTKRSATGPGIKRSKNQRVHKARVLQPGPLCLVAHGKRANSGTSSGVATPDASIDVPMIPRQVGNFTGEHITLSSPSASIAQPSTPHLTDNGCGMDRT